MTEKYLLDRNLVITGDLTVNHLINVSSLVNDPKEMPGVKNLSDLIGKEEEYKGNLTLDTLLIHEKSNYQLTVNGSTIAIETSNM